MKPIGLFAIIFSTVSLLLFSPVGERSMGAVAEPPTVANLPSISGHIHAPCRIATASNGDIYATDPQRGAVVTYRPWGAVKSLKNGLGLCLSIAVDSRGMIYVGDQKKGNVTAFDSDWRPLYKLGAGDGELSMPNDIAIDPSTERIYVADSKANLIKVYDSAGGKASQFGEWRKPDDTIDHLDYPTSLAIDTSRNEVLVADHNNGRIVIFNLDGTWIANIGRYGSAAGRFTRPLGVNVDSLGRIYVADAYQATVQVLDRSGQFLSFIGHYGAKSGQLRLPADVAIDEYNRLLVASTNNNRVEVYGLDDYTNPKPPVQAIIRIRPNERRARRRRGKIACYIELPGRDVSQIIISSIRLNGSVSCESRPRRIRDYDRDGAPDLLVRFQWRKVLTAIEPKGAVVLTITGRVGDETFEGSDVIQIVPSRKRDEDR